MLACRERGRLAALTLAWEGLLGTGACSSSRSLSSAAAAASAWLELLRVDMAASAGRAWRHVPGEL